jgi:membrane protease YdiL (CAAX protease family)
MLALRDLAARRPFLFAIGVFLAETMVAVPFVLVFRLLALDLTALRLIIPVAQSMLVVWVIWALGWARKSGFRREVREIQVYLYPVLVAFAPVLLHGTVEIAPGPLVFYAAAMLFTGLSEEGLARGLLLPALLPFGKWVALLFAAALFSAGHVSNIAFEEFGPLEWADKFLATFGFAILYGAVFLRTGTIWPLIVLHAVHDYSYLTSGTAGPFLTEPIALPVHMGLSLANLAVGLWIAAGADVSRWTEEAAP